MRSADKDHRSTSMDLQTTHAPSPNITGSIQFWSGFKFHQASPCRAYNLESNGFAAIELGKFFHYNERSFVSGSVRRKDDNWCWWWTAFIQEFNRPNNVKKLRKENNKTYRLQYVIYVAYFLQYISFKYH